MQNFKIGKRISDGAFGTVYEAETIKNDPAVNYPKHLAIKQVYTSSSNLKRQLSILKKLPANQHIVQIYHSISQNFTTHIVMQRGKYDLSQWISQNYYPIPEKIIKNIAFQILAGLNTVHNTKIIHRDLKPSNLVIRENGLLAICDFGSAVECTQGEQYEIQGFTRWYKCPQMLYGHRKYKYQADIWSVGCILMEVATGQPLFNGKSEIQQVALIAKLLGDPSIENWPSVVKMPDYNKITFKSIKPKTIEQIVDGWSVSKQFVIFILKMIRYENRLSIKQLLEDQYLQNIKISQSIDQKNQIRLKQQELISIFKKQKKI